MADRVARKYFETIKSRADIVAADTLKVRDVQRELENQSTGLGGQLAVARAQIDSVFEGMRVRGLHFVNQNLSFRKIGRSVNRELLQQQFQDEVVGRALRDIDEATRNYINALVDNSRQYWRSIIERLNQLATCSNRKSPGWTPEPANSAGFRKHYIMKPNSNPIRAGG
ncbi:MAG: hypothetical protein LC121_13850 [Anaerolineae bacterium]|nr:hypothetical protein [Anaerolineae bacterium]